jgi:hypothetical protein
MLSQARQDCDCWWNVLDTAQDRRPEVAPAALRGRGYGDTSAAGIRCALARSETCRDDTGLIAVERALKSFESIVAWLVPTVLVNGTPWASEWAAKERATFITTLTRATVNSTAIPTCDQLRAALSCESSTVRTAIAGALTTAL